MRYQQRPAAPASLPAEQEPPRPELEQLIAERIKKALYIQSQVKEILDQFLKSPNYSALYKELAETAGDALSVRLKEQPSRNIVMSISYPHAGREYSAAITLDAIFYEFRRVQDSLSEAGFKAIEAIRYKAKPGKEDDLDARADKFSGRKRQYRGGGRYAPREQGTDHKGRTRGLKHSHARGRR